MTGPIIKGYNKWTAENLLHQNFRDVGKFSAHLIEHATREGVGIDENIAKIDKVFMKRLVDLKADAFRSLHTVVKGVTLSKSKVKTIKTLFKSIENQEIKLLKELQLDLLTELAHSKVAKEPWSQALFEWKIRSLAGGNWFAKALAKLISTSNTVEAFRAATIVLTTASTEPFPTFPGPLALPLVDRDITTEFSSDPFGMLTKRSGVVGMEGIYRIQARYSEKEIAKQLKVFIQHAFSVGVRDPLTQDMAIEGLPLLFELVPLNAHFDGEIKGTGGGLFGKIFGKGGISALNRMEPHLINGYMMRVKDKDNNILLEGFRHAILAEKEDDDVKQRSKTSRQMAKELLLAPVLKDYSERGIDPLNPPDWLSPPKVHVVSISLVTPDSVRPALKALGIHQTNERQMLSDQVRALESFNGADALERLPTDLSVNCFNFGTNIGAVGLKTCSKSF